jgi:hypothetical protein
MIQTIPTTYNGIKYRSRLEARWAVFFNELGIKHRYEFEGFSLENKEYYLPDFYLPDYSIYCEVKPNFEEVDKNKKTFVNFSKTGQWLLLSVDTPNVNTTILFIKNDELKVIPFVNLIKLKYGNFWSSPFKRGSDKDGFIDYNIFKNACEVAEKYIFY